MNNETTPVDPKPPLLPRVLLERCVRPGPVGASIVGDLHEDYLLRRESGHGGADFWYWRVVVPLALSLLFWRLLGRHGGGRRSPESRSRPSAIDGWVGDLRYSLRGALRKPLFSLVAVGSLAIGIGANVAVFTIVNTAFVRSVPGIGPSERLVELGRTVDGQGYDTFAYPDIADLRVGAAKVLDQVAVFTFDFVSSKMVDGGERWNAMYTSANYLEILGVQPTKGRRFLDIEDERPPAEQVVILSHRSWRDRFGSDPEILGSTILISREPMTVVGVLPREFKSHILGFEPDVWLPLGQHPNLLAAPASGDLNRLENRQSSWLMSLGRLAEGASMAQASSVADAVFDGLEQEYGGTNKGRGVRLVELGPIPGGGRSGMAAFLSVLLGLVVLVLLITCSNVAGMLIANSAAREKEVAVRLAIGSSRWQLVRQLLSESMVLFLAGGLVGTLSAVVALRSVSLASLPLPISLDLELKPDLRVLAFTLAVTLLSGLIFGSLPALQASRPDLVSALRGLADSSSRRWLRKLLVTAQVAASMVLLVAAGLFLRSIQKIGLVETGFDGTGVYTTTLDLSLEGYESEERGLAFFESALERVKALPGVEAAAFSLDLPLDMTSRGWAVIPEDWDSVGSERFSVNVNQVTSGYLETLGIRLLEGRGIESNDSSSSERVALVNPEFVRRVWPGESPLGKSFVSMGEEDEPSYRIVGIVQEVKNTSITESLQPFVYFSLAQAYSPQMTLSARFAGNTSGGGNSLRGAILEVDPSLSLTPVLALDLVTGISTLPQRVAASVTSALGLVALLLSGIGIYGVVAFSVARRTREIGIRMALGAQRRNVLFGVIADAAKLAAPGIIVGLGLASAASMLAQSLLVEVSPGDPLTMIFVAFAIAVVVILASLVPARRASVVDPVEALRSD